MPKITQTQSGVADGEAHLGVWDQSCPDLSFQFEPVNFHLRFNGAGVQPHHVEV